MTIGRKMLAGGTSLSKVFAGVTPANLYVYDTTMLVTNTTNRHGVVDASGFITQLNGVAPGVAKNFPSSGNAPALTSQAAIYPIDTNIKRWMETTASTTFDFMYVGTSSTIKWTMFLALSPLDINGWSGIFGNSDFNNTIGGITINFDTGSTLTSLQVRIHNTSGTSVCFAESEPFATIGAMALYCIEVDLSQVAASRVKMWRGNTASTPTATGSNSPLSSGVTNKWAICSAGGAAGNTDYSGGFKHLSIINGLTPYRQRIMEKLSAYYKIAL